MIKHAIVGICLLTMSPMIFAVQSADQMASSCRSYLNTTVNANNANDAQQSLTNCVSNLSCTNTGLSDIPQCALQLNNALINAQVSNLNAANGNAMGSTYSPSPAAQPMQSPSPQTTDTQTKNSPQQKKSGINWF